MHTKYAICEILTHVYICEVITTLKLINLSIAHFHFSFPPLPVPAPTFVPTQTFVPRLKNCSFLCHWSILISLSLSFSLLLYPHDYFEVHPYSSVFRYIISLYFWVVLHCMHTLQFINLCIENFWVVFIVDLWTLEYKILYVICFYFSWEYT